MESGKDGKWKGNVINGRPLQLSLESQKEKREWAQW